MKKEQQTDSLLFVFGTLTTMFALTLILWGVVGLKSVSATVPAGYTCTLTASILKPCQGTCPVEKTCGKNVLDNCDCI
ncbi:hypothetical protein FACS189454_04670 [Planctomycetales bacterium]|nr:hypothetical protein FACS189454_04670 [Planctomycetales bacterium]